METDEKEEYEKLLKEVQEVQDTFGIQTRQEGILLVMCNRVALMENTLHRQFN